MLFFYFLCFLTFSFTSGQSKTCTKENCLLPSCQCPTNNGNPTSFDLIDLPQFVLLTFVGNLNTNVLDSIRSIFHSFHRNPNKCPISTTFFIHDVHTEYCLVQRLFDNHHEIAMTVSSNKCPLTNCYQENSWRRWTNKDWQREIKEQRINIVDKGQIHSSHIKGFRVPHLQIDGYQHFELLEKYHFHYDSSMLFKSNNFIWPFTLDYPFDHQACINCYNWTKPFEALWQFPLHEWTYPNSSISCRTLSDSSCLPADQTLTTDIYYDFLMHNFQRHSSLTVGRRSPFVIQLDLSWLAQNKKVRLQALLRFIQHLLTSPDHRYVYFVSIEKALEWFKYPRPLNELKDFWAFTCGDKTYEYDADCSNIDIDSTEEEKNNLNAQHLKSNNISNKTHSEYVDRQAEKLFPSNIALHALWVSIVLIVSVVIYDKYFTTK
ncbi:unnamed protein product [Adineta ricciae]|uniref:Uncharacterized protein n=1 Tax=Adineta ricciae TaxID=249248 RepID=A0A814A763_ADIRI|nr:unnamed protein product [Adineta ricciae]CAF0909481.1 unnamed protein product [Adineta ricciae]